MPPDVFICSAAPDAPHARALAAALRGAALTAFVDRATLLPGDPWDTAIPAALARARLVAVLVSPTWKGHAAWSAHDEVARAVARARDADGVRLVLLVLGDIAPLDMPSGLARLAPLPHADPAATAAALAALLAGACPAPGARTDTGPRVSRRRAERRRQRSRVREDRT